MKLANSDFNYYGFKLDKAKKHLGVNVEYLGTFCIKGAYKPAAVFYSPNPDLKKGHKHYPYLFMQNGGLYIGGMDSDQFEKERHQQGAYCLNCKVVLYSVMRHDFRPCKCKDKDKQIHVDGGKDYFRFLYNKKSSYDLVSIDFKTNQIKTLEKTS